MDRLAAMTTGDGGEAVIEIGDDTPIAMLPLSVRMRKRLAVAHGLATVADIKAKSYRDLIGDQWLGRVALAELVRVLGAWNGPIQPDQAAFPKQVAAAERSRSARSAKLVTVYRLYAEGLSFRAIGKRIGYTGANVSHLLKVADDELERGGISIEPEIVAARKARPPWSRS